MAEAALDIDDADVRAGGTAARARAARGGIIAFAAQGGESHWMEGVQLLAVDAILGIAFYFIPGQTV